MIWGEDVKEVERRLTHWERVSKKYGLQINLEKMVTLKLSTYVGKNIVEKINGKEIKADKFVYLGSVVENNGKIQNEK
jgi:hypothetical protein